MGAEMAKNIDLKDKIRTRMIKKIDGNGELCIHKMKPEIHADDPLAKVIDKQVNMPTANFKQDLRFDPFEHKFSSSSENSFCGSDHFHEGETLYHLNVVLDKKAEEEYDS